MRKERMNDKGFSLVELIIVIAIMAILIVVLAPQYLKYVERSRNSTDMQNVATIKTAIETYAADPQATEAFTGAFTFSITPTGGSGGDTASNAALTDAALNITDIKCSSRTRWDRYTLTGTPQSNGSIAWSYTSTVGAGGADNGALDAAMKGNS